MPEEPASPNAIDFLVDLIKRLPQADRKAFIDRLKDEVCFNCGVNQPCYCGPEYDE